MTRAAHNGRTGLSSIPCAVSVPVIGVNTPVNTSADTSNSENRPSFDVGTPHVGIRVSKEKSARNSEKPLAKVNQESQMGTRTWYHTAPTVDRHRIQTHGLIPSQTAVGNWPTIKGQPEGVYLWEDPKHAQDWGSRNGNNDIWKVTLPEDWETYGDQELGHSAGYTPHHIPPENLENLGFAQDFRWHPGPVMTPQEQLWTNEPDVGTKLYDKQFRQWGIGLPNHVIGNDSNRGPNESQGWEVKVADITRLPDGTIRNNGPVNRNWPNEEDKLTDMGEHSFPIWNEDYPYYHVAPTTERARIMQHGLQASNPSQSGQWTDPDVSWQVERQPTGTYLWDNKTDASDYVDAYERRTGTPMDVWGINHPNLPVTHDDVIEQAKVTPYSIAPQHLKMIYGPEHREEREGDIPVAAYRAQFPEEQALKENRQQWGIGMPNRVIGNRGPATESSWKLSDIPMTFNRQACPRCGGEIDPEDGYCYNCGYSIGYDGYEALEGHSNPYEWTLEQPWTLPPLDTRDFYHHEKNNWRMSKRQWKESVLEMPPTRKPFKMPEVLYHWTEARNAPYIHEGGLNGKGIYLTLDDHPAKLNPDVPELDVPFRVGVDTSQLDPSLFGQDTTEGYPGEAAYNLQTHGNTYYTAPIPRSAIIGMKKFKPIKREWEL
jgi:hypothetical protein